MVNRLVVLHRSIHVYDQRFHEGVNIIRGQNSSGKSTIIDFIFFGLGGDFASWRPEAARCDVVLVEVEINNQILTLRRGITPNKGQGMDIFWGDLDQGLERPFTEWQTYPARRTELKESFSQILFKLLGIPQVTGDKTSNITMHQILRLMCVDQLSNVLSILRDEQFDPALTRTTVAELLLGIYDDQLYSDQLALRSAHQNLSVQRVEHNSLISLLKEVGQFERLDETQNLIKETESELTHVQYQLAAGAVVEDSSVAKGADDLQKTQRLLSDKKAEYASLAKATNFLSLEISDSAEFIENLRRRLIAIEESIQAEVSLGHLALQLCPECLQPLSLNSEPDQCKLCHRPVPESGRNNRMLKLKNELTTQIDESNRLLSKKHDELALAGKKLKKVEEDLASLQRLFDDMVNVTRPSRDALMDELYVRRGALEANLTSLNDRLKFADRFHELSSSIKLLEREIADLGESIKAGEQRQSARRIQAQQAINSFALQFLHNDLDREGEFKVAQEVVTDFERNLCLVDGRSNFSASSMAYLKGAVHFAIFFASLVVSFFRYPKFISNDNIEDKGMEEIRSMNFQRILVDLSQRHDVKHQIIIATSMIAPELDNEKYCIGPKYTQNFKTLQFPSDI